MRIFALETDENKVKSKFIGADETELATIHYHFFKFLGVFVWSALLTAILIGLSVWLAFLLQVPLEWDIGIAVLAWLFLVFPKLFRAIIDWKYDFIVLTTDKLLMVDQSSIFKQKVTPINLESISSASAETQFWNLFAFGILHIDLQESVGAEHRLPYIKFANDIAAKMTAALTAFQRRKDLRRYAHGDPVQEQA